MNRLYCSCIVCICFLVFLPERGTGNNDLEKVSATAPMSLKRLSIIWGRAWKERILILNSFLVFPSKTFIRITFDCIMIMVMSPLHVLSCIIIFNTHLNGPKLGFEVSFFLCWRCKMSRTWTLNLDRFHEILTPAEKYVINTPNIKSSDENVYWPRNQYCDKNHSYPCKCWVGNRSNNKNGLLHWCFVILSKKRRITVVKIVCQVTQRFLFYII